MYTSANLQTVSDVLTSSHLCTHIVMKLPSHNVLCVMNLSQFKNSILFEPCVLMINKYTGKLTEVKPKKNNANKVTKKLLL